MAAAAPTAEARRAERDRRRRIVSTLPRTNDTTVFIASCATMLLDFQEAVEDAAHHLQAANNDDIDQGLREHVAGTMNHGLVTANELYSKLVLAGKILLSPKNFGFKNFGRHFNGFSLSLLSAKNCGFPTRRRFNPIFSDRLFLFFSQIRLYNRTADHGCRGASTWSDSCHCSRYQECVRHQAGERTQGS